MSKKYQMAKDCWRYCHNVITDLMASLEEYTDDALGLEDVSWLEDRSPNPTSVSAHDTDASPEDLLELALFDTEAPTSQSSS
jgi:hypothetical protein